MGYPQLKPNGLFATFRKSFKKAYAEEKDVLRRYVLVFTYFDDNFMEDLRIAKRAFSKLEGHEYFLSDLDYEGISVFDVSDEQWQYFDRKYGVDYSDRVADMIAEKDFDESKILNMSLGVFFDGELYGGVNEEAEEEKLISFDTYCEDDDEYDEEAEYGSEVLNLVGAYYNSEIFGSKKYYLNLLK